MSTKPIIAITMGDAAGIGPEVTVKCLAMPQIHDLCHPVVLGDAGVIADAIKIAAVRLKLRIVSSPAETARPDEMCVIDFGGIDRSKLRPGEVNPMCGKAAVNYTLEAGKMAMDDAVHAIVSAPLNKQAMRAAGFRYEGQTQILGELTGSRRYGMLLLLGNIRMMLATTHVSLRKAIGLITKERLQPMIELAAESVGEFFGITDPRVAVSALNPHAGEGGLFGAEEIEEIIPAIQAAKANGVNALGPIPADTIFVRAKAGDYDAVVALYHDQGTAASKLLGFGRVVTLLAGIPIIRTSVGHGTAFDIAGTNKADHLNLAEAIKVAAELAERRIRVKA
jgi:4-hydroxythreonine-4-phosphate dehydrogenase